MFGNRSLANTDHLHLFIVCDTVRCVGVIISEVRSTHADYRRTGTRHSPAGVQRQISTVQPGDGTAGAEASVIYGNMVTIYMRRRVDRKSPSQYITYAHRLRLMSSRVYNRSVTALRSSAARRRLAGELRYAISQSNYSRLVWWVAQLHTFSTGAVGLFRDD